MSRIYSVEEEDCLIHHPSSSTPPTQGHRNFGVCLLNQKLSSSPCVGVKFSWGDTWRAIFWRVISAREGVFSIGSGHFPGGLTPTTEKGQAKIKKER